MQVLVDSSIWIDYFRHGKNSASLDYYIDENMVVINNLILAELIPFLKIKNQRKIIRLLQAIKRVPLDIRWEQIIESQYKCLKQGISGIGIPDLIIAHNALQNHCAIYSLDKHFRMLDTIINIHLV